MNRDGYYIIFDSGVGGLSILKEIINQNVKSKFLYVADNKWGSYGDKSEYFIRKRMIEVIGDLQNCYKLKGIILACNTASVVGKEKIEEFFKLPVFSISDQITKCINDSEMSDIAVLATERTVASNFFLRNTNKGIYQYACPSFASFIESEEYYIPEKRKRVVYRELIKINRNFEEIYLGCTHYPFLKNEIENFFMGKAKVIDPAFAFVSEIKKYIKNDSFRILVYETANTKKVSNKLFEYCLNKNSLVSNKYT